MPFIKKKVKWQGLLLWSSICGRAKHIWHTCRIERILLVQLPLLLLLPSSFSKRTYSAVSIYISSSLGVGIIVVSKTKKGNRGGKTQKASKDIPVLTNYLTYLFIYLCIKHVPIKDTHHSLFLLAHLKTGRCSKEWSTILQREREDRDPPPPPPPPPHK